MKVTLQKVAKLILGWDPADKITSETAWLNGLRGLAAYNVMMAHYSWALMTFLTEAPFGSQLLQDIAYGDEKVGSVWWYPKGTRLWAPWRLPILRVFITNGGGQVAIFFVISGFVLTHSLLGFAQSNNFVDLYQTLASSVFRRWSRLYLPVVIVSYAYAFKTYLAGNESLWNVTSHYLAIAWRWMNPLLSLDQAKNAEFKWVNAVVWTIPYEFSGSLAVYALTLVLGRFSMSRRLSIMAIVMVIAFTTNLWHLVLFIAGMALADYTRQHGTLSKQSSKLNTWRTSTLMWTILLLAGMVLMGYPLPMKEYYDRPGYEWTQHIPLPEGFRKDEGEERAWWALGAICVVTSACHLRYVRAFFELAPLQHLGKVSFMLYLIHSLPGMLIGMRLQKLMYAAVCTYEAVEPYKLPICRMNMALHVVILLGVGLVSVMIALIIAHVLEVFVDRPITNYGKRVDKWLLSSWSWQGEVVQDQLEREMLLDEVGSKEMELEELPVHGQRHP